MSVTLNRVGGTFVSGSEVVTNIDGGAVTTEEQQRTVLMAKTGAGATIHLPGTTAHGLRADTKVGVATTVDKIPADTDEVVVSAANASRRMIRIHFDAPATEIVYILEGGTGPITNDNWSFPLWGGQTYMPPVPSTGEYAAWWANQAAVVGSLRVTEG